MLKKVKLTDKEMREFAEVFAYYDYGDEIIDSDTIKITFDEYQKSIATGQSVVLYDEDTVIGGGVIDRVE